MIRRARNFAIGYMAVGLFTAATRIVAFDHGGHRKQIHVPRWMLKAAAPFVFAYQLVEAMVLVYWRR